MITHEQVIDYLSSVAQDVIDGKLDPIDGWINLHEVDKVVKELKKSIQDDALHRAEDLGCDHIQRNYHVKTMSKSTYSFRHSDRWKQAYDELKKIEAQMKFACANGQMADTDSGEIIEPAQVKHTNYINLTYKPNA